MPLTFELPELPSNPCRIKTTLSFPLLEKSKSIKSLSGVRILSLWYSMLTFLNKEGIIVFMCLFDRNKSGRYLELAAGDCMTIPAEVYHEVSCSTDAKFFVVLPNQAKMKFAKWK